MGRLKGSSLILPDNNGKIDLAIFFQNGEVLCERLNICSFSVISDRLQPCVSHQHEIAFALPASAALSRNGTAVHVSTCVDYP